MRRKADLLRVLPEPRSGPAVSLPPQARRLVEAVRKGRGQAFLPPRVEPGPEGVVTVARPWQGEEDARLVASMLARPCFRPLREWLEEVHAWCRSTARRYPRLLGPRVLTLGNAELFGPLVEEAFTLCAAAGEGPEHPGLRVLWEGFQSFFARFVSRLARDVRAGVLRRAGFSGPVTGLWAHPEETHNGRQCVLRLRFRRGGYLAYKPRPAGGEALFLGEGRARSLFGLLNALPAASGAVRLPTLRVLEGRGEDGFAYSWQEWVPRPRQWGVVRRSERLNLEACQLTPAQAEGFWHRAGSLSAACFAFGVADLYAGNVLVGARRGERAPLPYPVDLELFFAPLRRLSETGLVADERERGNHHVGFERQARWCTTGGPLACFFPSPEGGLHLRRRTEPWARQESRSVIADTEGHIGFGAYLTAYLRGMFDVWTLLLMERPRIVRFLRSASRGRYARILLKDTGLYVEELARMALSPGRVPPERPARGVRFSREEREQLRRFDVPYFFRTAEGGPLLYVAEPLEGAEWRQAGRQHVLESHVPLSAEALGEEHLTLPRLGVAVRDAVAFVLRDVRDRVQEDARRGVRVELRDASRGTVSFDWREVGKRLTLSWNRRELRVSMDSL